jgi:hypothetical protein
MNYMKNTTGVQKKARPCKQGRVKNEYPDFLGLRPRRVIQIVGKLLFGECVDRSTDGLKI